MSRQIEEVPRYLQLLLRKTSKHKLWQATIPHLLSVAQKPVEWMDDGGNVRYLCILASRSQRSAQVWYVNDDPNGIPQTSGINGGCVISSQRRGGDAMKQKQEYSDVSGYKSRRNHSRSSWIHILRLLVIIYVTPTPRESHATQDY